jgi:hypothetical protein
MVHFPERFEVEPPLERGPRWSPLVASAALHILIILILLFGVPGPTAPAAHLPPTGQAPQPIAFAVPQPKRVVPPAPQPAPQKAPPPIREQILGPDAKQPAAVPKEAAKPPVPDVTPPAATPQTLPEPSTRAPEKPPASAPEKAPAPSRSPIRIPQPGDYLGGQGIVSPTPSPFPPTPLDRSTSPSTDRATVLGMGGLGMASPAEHYENSFDDQTQGTCVEIPDLGKNPDGTPVLAAVTGHVYEEDGVTPLANAHLQIIGYPYGTFSDANGAYRLEFDPKTLAHCRSQYVVVAAAGHRSQTLMLAIGPEVVSPPILMRRK